MPYFLATKKHFYTIRLFRERVSRGREVLEPLPYEEMTSRKGLRRRAIIFGDIDRLILPAAERMSQNFRNFSRRLPAGAVINDPARVMGRYELLRRLYERGINSFNVYRLSEAREPERFPVFVRRDSEHGGAASDLLHDRAALEAEIERMLAANVPRNDILIVEYLDYRSPDGRFRKYGTFRVGPKLVPAQVEISDKWVIKMPALLEPQVIEEEFAYVSAKNPHAPLLREIFDMAGIGYGRMDYTLVDGKPQIFEINTNPVIIGPRSKVRERRQTFQKFIPRLVTGFAALDQLVKRRRRLR
ncbi:MAG: hypothetical protein WEC00_08265 [Dongiaceae bacterium]